MTETKEQQQQEQQQAAGAPAPAENLTGHNYDGIEEYDNPTPAWWTWIFVATILFSAVYFFVATMSGGQLSPQAYYDREVVADLKRQGGALQADAATLVRLAKDEESMKVGQNVYSANCVACHGRNGEGVTGPNLTDEAFIHVKKVEDIVDVVKNGRANGAMPAWKMQLSPNEVVQVSAYVASLRGKNLQGKQAEGQKAAPWAAQ